MTRERREGFTLIEVLVAIVILLIGVLSLIGSSRIAAASVRRSTVELRAVQLLHDEVERLSTIPLDSLVDGTSTRPGGTSSWVVVDSVTFLRVELAITTAPLAGTSLQDTVFLYRSR
jgi:prepilin-type N-terminal cleavage/methylation domain-containing protein